MRNVKYACMVTACARRVVTIAFSNEPILLKIKISCIWDNLIMVLTDIQHSISCLKTDFLITSYGRLDICSIFQSLQPSPTSKNMFGSKFPKVQIIKTYFKQHSNGLLRVQNQLLDCDLRSSQYLLCFLKAIALSTQLKLLRLKI